MGATTGNHHTDLTLGAEYELRLIEKLGLGVTMEHSPEAHDGDGVSMGLANIYFHPWKGIRVGAAAGRERVHDHDGSEQVWRATAAYEFHVGHWLAIPTFAVDRVSGHELVVAGVAFGYAF